MSTENWVQLLLAFVAVSDIGIGIAIWYVNAKAARIGELETKVEKQTEDKIEAKFDLVKAELNQPITELRTLVNEIKIRLANGDATFDEQFEEAKKLALSQLSSVAGTREWVLTNFVTREELKAFMDRMNAVEQRLATIRASAQMHKN